MDIIAYCIVCQVKEGGYTVDIIASCTVCQVKERGYMVDIIAYCTVCQVKEGGYMYTANSTALTEWIRQNNICDIVFLKDKYIRAGMALMVQQGSPYEKHFDQV